MAKDKNSFFVRVGRFLAKNPFLAGIVGLVLLVISYYLVAYEKGALFVAGFCLLMLSATSFYITLRGFLR